MANENNSTPAPQATPNEPVESQVEETSGGEQEGSEEQPQEGKALESATPAEKKELAKTLKKLKIKFNQKEFEEELPFEIPDTEEARNYMTRQLQLGRHGQNSAREKAEYEKQVSEFIETLKTNPRAVLTDPTIGIDLKKLAAEILQEELENSNKTPEQIEKENLEKELKSLRDEREKEKKDLQEKEFQRLQQASFESYQTQIKTALKDSSLPESPYVVRKIADYLLEGIKGGLDISVADVLPLVEQEVQSDIQAMFSAMPEDVVLKIIGKEKLNNIRKKSLAKAKATPPQPLKTLKDTGGRVEKKEEAPKQSYKQFFKI